MENWSSPLPIPERCIELLQRLGLRRLHQPDAEAPCLFLYDAPDQLLMAAAEEGGTLSAVAMMDGYRTLGKRVKASKLISGWRLLSIPEQALHAWLHDQVHMEQALPAGLRHKPPRISSLAAMLALQLIESQPGLRDAYLDLELQSELAGTEPDSACQVRYRQLAEPGIVLQDWQAVTHSARAKEEECLELQARIERLEQDLDTGSAALTTLQQQLLVGQEEYQLKDLQAQQLEDEMHRLYKANLAIDARLKAVEAERVELDADNAKLAAKLKRSQHLLAQATQIIGLLRSHKTRYSRTKGKKQALLPPWRG